MLAGANVGVIMDGLTNIEANQPIFCVPVSDWVQEHVRIARIQQLPSMARPVRPSKEARIDCNVLFFSSWPDMNPAQRFAVNGIQEPFQYFELNDGYNYLNFIRRAGDDAQMVNAGYVQNVDFELIDQAMYGHGSADYPFMLLVRKCCKF